MRGTCSRASLWILRDFRAVAALILVGLVLGVFGLYGSSSNSDIARESEQNLAAALAEMGYTKSQRDQLLHEVFEIFKSSDYKRAKSLIEPLAQAGDADAQYLLALILYWPSSQWDSGEPDPEEAMHAWARRAALQEHAGGQYLYGASLLPDPDVTREGMVEAMKWLRRAAYQDLVEAQALLAVIYLEIDRIPWEAGRFARNAADSGNIFGHLASSVIELKRRPKRRNLARAAKGVRIAAHSGFIEAQVTYATFLARGFGVRQDHVAAFKWLEIAHELGSNDDQKDLRSELHSKLTPQEIEYARHGARRWLETVRFSQRGLLARALRWCDQYQSGDSKCYRTAALHDYSCLPPDLPVSPGDGFRETAAYDLCRQHVYESEMSAYIDRGTAVDLLRLPRPPAGRL